MVPPFSEDIFYWVVGSVLVSGSLTDIGVPKYIGVPQRYRDSQHLPHLFSVTRWASFFILSYAITSDFLYLLFTLIRKLIFLSVNFLYEYFLYQAYQTFWAHYNRYSAGIMSTQQSGKQILVCVLTSHDCYSSHTLQPPSSSTLQLCVHAQKILKSAHCVLVQISPLAKQYFRF